MLDVSWQFIVHEHAEYAAVLRDVIYGRAVSSPCSGDVGRHAVGNRGMRGQGWREVWK